MDTPLPPFSSELWPKVRTVFTSRQPEQELILEIHGLSERPLLGALARAIHSEMQGAGEWAARIPTERDKSYLSYPGPRDFFRLHADDASRLLALYTALHEAVHPDDSILPTPESLKDSATRRYQIGLRDEKERQQKLSPGFNDVLYDSMKIKSPGEGLKI